MFKKKVWFETTVFFTPSPSKNNARAAQQGGRTDCELYQPVETVLLRCGYPKINYANLLSN